MTEHVLTDADGQPIDGERYEDSDRAIDARARLMGEQDGVTVEQVPDDGTVSDRPEEGQGWTEEEIRKMERIRVRRDGKEVDVFDWCNVVYTDTAMLRGGTNPVHQSEEEQLRINAGDANYEPDAITHWLAEEIEFAYDIDVAESEEHDIEVIDPTAEEVTVL